MGGVAGEIEAAGIGGDVITIVKVEVERRSEPCYIRANRGNGEKDDQDP
jgi:hypothetical protein